MTETANHPSQMQAQSRVWPVVLAGFAVGLSLCWPMIARTWATGDFLDTDDAMRMVQVRDWLAGQGWFDLTAHRLDPPAGSPMHWSRLVDLPIAALLRLASLFAPAESAERIARIAYPLLLQIALISTLAAIGRLLCGTRGAICAVVLVVLSGFMIGQFVPGRVDHHSMQILLLVVIVGSLLAALDHARSRMAPVASLAMALSLSISLENLPFMLVGVTILPAAWILQGKAMVPALRSFGIALLAALPACFALFHAETASFEASCDAYSIAHLAPGLMGALACIGLAASGARTLSGRLLLGLVAGIAVCTAVAPFRTCLGDPFVGLDPLVREIWLANTTEARSLRQVLAIHPSAWPLLIMPVALGLCGMLAGALVTQGIDRARWLALLPLTAAGALTASWIIRAESSLSPLALLGGVFICSRVWDRLALRTPLLAAPVALTLAIPFTGIGWALMTPIDDNVAERERLQRAAICREAKGYLPLAALPAGLVFAPMDAGSHLLAHTPHTVLGAPYHRNNHGNRLVLDALLASPADAEAMVRATGARWLAICPGEVQLDVTAARSPNGLAARLLAGDVPAWLVPLEMSDTPFKVFRLP